MAENMFAADLLFQITTPLGLRVRVTKAYWTLIVEIKHPVMKGHEQEVQEALRNPEQVRLSKRDPQVYLFCRAERGGRWVCAVAERLDGEGYLITAYPTDAIKEGAKIWPK